MTTDGSATSLGPSTGVEGFAFAPGTPASSQDVEDASAASEDEEEEVREDENEVGIEKNIRGKRDGSIDMGRRVMLFFLVEGVDRKHENRCIVKKYEEIINTQHIYIYMM